MSVLVQISDAHFGTERLPVVKALLELVEQTKPAVTVLSGDITQRARRSQFATAKRFVEQLSSAHVLAIPGNHDIPLFNPFLRAVHPYSNYQRALGDVLEPQFESDAFMVICVNTTRAYRHKDGEVSSEQIDRVTRRLDSAHEGQLRIVVVHQPVHVIRSQDIENLLHGREAAVRAWSAAGADIIMGGHIHLPYVRELSEAYAGLPRRGWAVQAGTAVSHRVRDHIPNSINIIRHLPGEVTGSAERWDFNLVSGRFEHVETHNMALDREVRSD